MAEKKSGAKKSSAKKGGAKKSAAKKSSSKKSSSARKTTAAKKRSSSAKKGAAKKRTSRSTPEFSGKTVAEFRQALSTNLIKPLDMVMLSRGRIEQALEEVVKRGRMTRDDAQQLGQALLILGLQQTDDVLKDLEQLMGRGRTGLEKRTGNVRGRSADAA